MTRRAALLAGLAAAMLGCPPPHAPAVPECTQTGPAVTARRATTSNAATHELIVRGGPGIAIDGPVVLSVAAEHEVEVHVEQTRITSLRKEHRIGPQTLAGKRMWIVGSPGRLSVSLEAASCPTLRSREIELVPAASEPTEVDCKERVRLAARPIVLGRSAAEDGPPVVLRSEPPGIDCACTLAGCGPSCEADVGACDRITLRADLAAGEALEGWSSCEGKANECILSGADGEVAVLVADGSANRIEWSASFEDTVGRPIIDVGTQGTAAATAVYRQVVTTSAAGGMLSRVATAVRFYDDEGRVRWGTRFGGLTGDVVPRSIAAAPDGGAVLLASFPGHRRSLRVARLNPDGEVLWTHVFEHDGDGLLSSPDETITVATTSELAASSVHITELDGQGRTKNEVALALEPVEGRRGFLIHGFVDGELAALYRGSAAGLPSSVDWRPVVFGTTPKVLTAEALDLDGAAPVLGSAIAGPDRLWWLLRGAVFVRSDDKIVSDRSPKVLDRCANRRPFAARRGMRIALAYDVCGVLPGFVVLGLDEDGKLLWREQHRALRPDAHVRLSGLGVAEDGGVIVAGERGAALWDGDDPGGDRAFVLRLAP